MKIFKAIQDMSKNIHVKSAPSSVASQASKSIYYFPIMISDTVSTNTATMMSSNLESLYSSFMKACFSLNPAVKVKGDKVDVAEYLKTFHQNLGIHNADEYYLSLTESMDEWVLFPNDTLNEATLANVSAVLTKDTPLNKAVIDLKSIEKKNGMAPSYLDVEIGFMFDSGIVKCKLPIGIKCIIHPVDGSKLRDQLITAIAGRNIFNSIIRYTTGEMISLTDTILGTSNIKNGLSGKDDAAKWMTALDHRKRLNRLSMGFLGKKPYLPNLSMIISNGDVKDIENTVGYNLLKEPKRAVKFMKDNFLLSFVVVDDITETAYVLIDGHADFEEYPYTSIKRENQKNSEAINALLRGIGAGSKLI